MPTGLLSSADSFVAALSGFEPRVYSPDDCVTIVEKLSRVEKACAAARALAAARVSECGAHRGQGFANAADWLARETGSSSAEAERELTTAQQLDELPRTRAALSAGELSMEQAHEVASTEKVCPGSEKEMLDTAQQESLRTLKEKARTKRLTAIDPEDLHRRQRAARYHRYWRDEMGMVRYSGAMMPEAGIPFMNRLDVQTDREWRKGNREGRPEARECHAADAFARMVSGEGKGHAVRADVVYVCDITTGAAHIVGGGPVPESTLREAARTAFIKAVLHDGVQVDTIAHYGKNMPAMLRTVLELGDPPEFEGVTCCEENCDRRYGLEWDHVDPRANGGITARHNYKPRCEQCHRDKTERDRRAGLLRGARSRSQPP